MVFVLNSIHFVEQVTRVMEHACLAILDIPLIMVFVSQILHQQQAKIPTAEPLILQEFATVAMLGITYQLARPV